MTRIKLPRVRIWPRIARLQFHTTIPIIPFGFISYYDSRNQNLIRLLNGCLWASPWSSKSLSLFFWLISRKKRQRLLDLWLNENGQHGPTMMQLKLRFSIKRRKKKKVNTCIICKTIRNSVINYLKLLWMLVQMIKSFK